MRLPFDKEKPFEIQAHSLPVERIRVSFDGNYLFSVGQDGVFCIFDIKDKDPNKKKKEESIPIIIAEEILIPKAERDRYQ